MAGEELLPDLRGFEHAGLVPDRRPFLGGEQVFQIGLGGDLHVHPVHEVRGAAAHVEADETSLGELARVIHQFVEGGRGRGNSGLFEGGAVVPDVQHLGFLGKHVEMRVVLGIAEAGLFQQRGSEVLLPVASPRRSGDIVEWLEVGSVCLSFGAGG